MRKANWIFLMMIFANPSSPMYGLEESTLPGFQPPPPSTVAPFEPGHEFLPLDVVDRTEDVFYYSPFDTPNFPKQRMAIYHPNTPAPFGGYPVLMAVQMNNFETSSYQTSYRLAFGAMPTRLAYWALTNGFAVASVEVTTGYNEDHPLEFSNEHASEPDGWPYSGSGIQYPPGVTIEGATGLFEPYRDPSMPSSLKDVIYAIQFLRKHADDLSLDPERIVVQGGSSSATSLMWIALGNERQGEGAPQAPLDTQHGHSTRPQAFICVNGQTYVPYIDVGLDRMEHLGAPRYPEAGDQPDSEAALYLSSADLSFANPLSPLFYSNRGVPTYLAYDREPANTNYQEPLNNAGAPFDPSLHGLNPQNSEDEMAHSAFFGAIWRHIDPRPQSRFALFTYIPKTPCCDSSTLGPPCVIHPGPKGPGLPGDWDNVPANHDFILRDHRRNPVSPIILDILSWSMRRINVFANLDWSYDPLLCQYTGICGELAGMSMDAQDAAMTPAGPNDEYFVEDYSGTWESTFAPTGYRCRDPFVPRGAAPYLACVATSLPDGPYEFTLRGAPPNWYVAIAYGRELVLNPSPCGGMTIHDPTTVEFLNEPISTFQTDSEGALDLAFEWPQNGLLPPQPGEQICFQAFVYEFNTTPNPLVASNGIVLEMP